MLITAGRGFGQWRRVTANDAETLTLASPWRVVPDATSEYCVEKFFVENTYFANVNDTPGRLSLWLDCIGCLVDAVPRYAPSSQGYGWANDRRHRGRPFR